MSQWIDACATSDIDDEDLIAWEHDGYDRCLGVNGFQHFFSNALGLNSNNTYIFHPL